MRFDFLDHDEKKLVLPIIFVAFIIRLLFIVETTGTPFVEHPFSDSEIYLNHATEIVESGNWIGDEPYFMAPVYPYILAVAKIIFGDSTLIIRFLQVLVSTLTLLLLYATARNYFNKSVGIIALVIGAFYNSYIFYSGIIFSETFQIFVIALLIYLFSNKGRQTTAKFWLLSGIVFGIAVLFRGNIILFLPAVIIYFLFNSRLTERTKLSKSKLTAAFILGTLIAILPVTIRNAVVSGEFIPLTTNGGINFYIGNNEDAVGVFKTPENFNFEEDMSGRNYAERITGAELTASEASSFWYEKTFEEISENPLNFAELFIKKFFLFFDSQPFPQSSILNMEFYKDNYSNVLKLPLIDYSLIVLLFIPGLILSIRQKKADSILLILTAVYIFASMLFFVNGRFRLGITPALLIFASFGLYSGFQLLKTGTYKQLKLPVTILAVFVIISYFFISKPQFSNYDAYLQLGDIAQENERYDEAIYNYNRSMIIKDNYKTFMNLGNTFAKKKDFRNAISAYSEAEKRNQDDHLLYFNRGIVYSQVGEYDKAIEQFNKSLELKSDFAPAIRNIGIIYFVNENYADAEFYFNKFLEMSDDEATKALVRQDLETIRQKLGGN